MKKEREKYTWYDRMLVIYLCLIDEKLYIYSIERHRQTEYFI